MKKENDPFSEVHKRVKKAGQLPGTLTYTGDNKTLPPRITVVTFDAQNYHETTGTHLADCLPERKYPGVTWVNIEGLNDTTILDELMRRFDLHPLTMEDILNIEQRPKIEEFDHYLFVTLKSLQWQKDQSNFSINQISLIIGDHFILSFQEYGSHLFDTIRTRLQSTPNQQTRQKGSDYLAYRLMDAVIDEYFVVLEALGDITEETEERIIHTPTPYNVRMIYRLKRQMLLLRKSIWPMREVISHMLYLDDKIISSFTRVYLRDVYDHTVQAIDSLETFRDMLSSMLDMYLSSLTNRMNEIMKTLTIIATIFIPITWVAGVYGMNFANMPGTHWRYGYPMVMGFMLFIALIMLVYFYRRKWI